jgi:polyhydroxyalkanoate synthesis regulator phasin
MPETVKHIKNMLLAGYGSLVLTRERIESIVEELVDRGNIKDSEAETLALKLNERAEAERRMLTQLVKEQMDSVVRQCGFMTREDAAGLEKRLGRIEKLLP